MPGARRKAGERPEVSRLECPPFAEWQACGLGPLVRT